MKWATVIILGVLISNPAWALFDRWAPSEDRNETFTKISGNKATAETRVESKEFGSIVSLSIYEHKDRPCEVLINLRRAGGNLQFEYDDADRRCGKGVSLGNWSDPLLELPPGYIATGFQVCQAKGNNRVKGYKLTGRLHSRDRSKKFLSDKQTLPFMRPNCERWRQERSCKEGAVLTGFKLHYKSYAGNRPWELTGMAGVCRDLVWQGDTSIITR